MHGKIRIEDFEESNIEDLILVCSSGKLSDPIHQQGVNMKKQWLREMLDKYGSCAKIAYYNEKATAQILYYPEEADVTRVFRRKNVLVINCVYNPAPKAQKRGIGTMLLRNVVDDAIQMRTCLGNKPCDFMLAKAFNTKEFLNLPEFYRKNGFTPTPIDEENLLYLPISGRYKPAQPLRKYESLPEDRGKAMIFYSPICQFSFQFAKKIEKTVRDVAPDIRVEMINKWQNPEEAIKHGNCELIVNAKPIQTFFMETEKFKEELKQAI